MNVWDPLTNPHPGFLHFLPGRIHAADSEGDIQVTEITPGAAAPEQGAEPAPLRRLAHVPAIENPWSLTAAQCAVLSWLAEGMSYRDIARTNRCVPKTAEMHALAAVRVMGAINRVHAVVQWDRFIRGRAAA